MSKHNKIKFINFNLFNNEKYLLLLLLFAFTQLAMVQCEKEDDHDDHDHMAVIIDIKYNVA